MNSLPQTSLNIISRHKKNTDNWIEFLNSGHDDHVIPHDVHEKYKKEMDSIITDGDFKEALRRTQDMPENKLRIFENK